jgi:Protein of unknown function (DUF3105)/TIR domain
VTGYAFISFERDEALAYTDGLARYLGDAGVPVWYDRAIGDEQRWAEVMARLQGCAAVVVVMTPGVEQSAWVRGEIDAAIQLGKPILPLLLGGAPLAILNPRPYEAVLTGAMPSAGAVAQLRSWLAPPPFAAPMTAPMAAQMAAPVAAPASGPRIGLIVGIGAGVVALVVAVVAVVALISFGGRQGGGSSAPPQSWQDRAAAIPGIQDYLVTHPEWYVIGAAGNHQQGPITYPVSPPAGGIHNPVWQNCMGDVYPAEIPKERATHSLEHGAVWITYRPDLPKAEVDKLAAKVRNVTFMLMSPYPGQDRPISLQAWGYQLKVDKADDARIDAFIDALRRNATQEPQASCSGGSSDTGSEP